MSVASERADQGRMLAALASRPRTLLALVLLGLVVVTCSGFLLLESSSGDGFQVMIEDAPEPAEVLRLSSLLCKEGIGTRIEDGGQTLRVERLRHQEAVRLIMEEGLSPLPTEAGSDFFGLGQGLEVSPEDSRQRACRAREAELARTLGLYPAVQFARVHLNLPDTHGFGSSGGEPSASVFLGLKSFRRLSGAQARAIRELVAHAIEGLAVERVVLADSRGTDYDTLIRREGSRDLVTAEEHLRVLRSAERQAEEKILGHLQPLFGAHNVSVSVVTVLDAEGEGEGLEAPLVKGLPVRYRTLAVTLDTGAIEGECLTTAVAETIRASVLASLGVRETETARVRVRGAPFRRRGEAAGAGPAAAALEPAKALLVHPATSPELPASGGDDVRRYRSGSAFPVGVALPFGVLFLFAGSLGVISVVRAAPCPSTLAGAPQEFDPVDMRTDSGVRRMAVSLWSEEDPEFAARIVARLLEDDA